MRFLTCVLQFIPSVSRLCIPHRNAHKHETVMVVARGNRTAVVVVLWRSRSRGGAGSAEKRGSIYFDTYFVLVRRFASNGGGFLA